jgi:transcriptional regulator with XRE-family HTH domain
MYAIVTAVETFGTWLANELEDRGWSMSELGRRCGVSHVAISRAISGERNPSAALCSAIARAFRIPPEMVFRRAGLLPEASEEVPGLGEAVFLFRKLPQDERHRILLFMRSLLEEREGVEHPMPG